MSDQVLLSHDLSKALADLRRSAVQTQVQARGVMKRGEALVLRTIVRAAIRDGQRAEALLDAELGEDGRG
jgi:hypothetical protein